MADNDKKEVNENENENKNEQKENKNGVTEHEANQADCNCGPTPIEMWSITTKGAIWCSKTGKVRDFLKVDGALKMVSVGVIKGVEWDGPQIWGVNKSNEIYQYKGIHYNGKFKLRFGNSRLKQLDVGSELIWGVNNDGNLWIVDDKKGCIKVNKKYFNDWGIKQVSSGHGGITMGINALNKICRNTTNKIDGQWEQIKEKTENNWKQVSVGKIDGIWCLTEGGHIFLYDEATKVLGDEIKNVPFGIEEICLISKNLAFGIAETVVWRYALLKKEDTEPTWTRLIHDMQYVSAADTWNA